MSLVNEASKIPFVIWRNDGKWNLDYIGIAENSPKAYLAEVEAKDPYALMLNGTGFSRGSFSFVYDKVLIARLYKEYQSIQTDEAHTEKLYAIANFIEDNLSEMSHETSEYLTTLKQPLAFLDEILPISIQGEKGDYDEDKKDEAIDLIELHIKERINSEERAEPIEKRTVDDYEEKICIQLGGKHIVLSENSKETTDLYLICDITRDNALGIEERRDIMYTDDYLYALGEFIYRVDAAVEALRAERYEARLPLQKLTVADCVPSDNDVGWEGKVVIVKPEALMPEYRNAVHQLAICTGGFGSKPNSRGNAVYVKELHSGKQMRYERHQIAGLADHAKLPSWAKDKLPEPIKPDAAPQKLPRKPKTSVLAALDEGKAKVAQADAARAVQNKPPTRKRSGQEQGD